ITFAFQDKDISCKYSCEKGRFFDGVNIDANNIHKVDTIVNKTVWWSYYNEEMEFVYNDYISILLLKNNNVVGYAVIKIDCESSTRYQASILNQEMLDVPILETKALQLIENIKNKEGDNC
ncbi:MAG: hypothetical protein IJW26_03075, partial [Clostridia bacterium]|nr:hypothetical protein [Clostridia bacterium]